MDQRKIAVFSGQVPSTTFIERLIKGLADDGFKIYLFGSNSKKVSYSKNIFLVTYSNTFQKFIILKKYTILLLLFKRKEKKAIDKIIAQKESNSNFLKVKYYPVLYHKPDIFHLQWGKGIADWIWVQDFGIKIILSLRGTHITISPSADQVLAFQYQTYFPQIDGFHAVSNAIKIEAEKFGAPASKIKIIYSGLNVKKIPFSLNKIQNNPIKIVSIGRSHWVKGYTYALEAFSLLKDKNFEFQYSIVGVENEEELIFQRAQLGLEKHVSFEKSMPFQNIITAIQKADVLLLSSVEEGIANVVLEAMALGTIVLSTNCGGMDEVIVNGENGFLVPIRNPQAIADKIIKISSLSVSDKFLICKRARTAVENQHGFDTMIFQMKDLYNSVLENNE